MYSKVLLKIIGYPPTWWSFFINEIPSVCFFAKPSQEDMSWSMGFLLGHHTSNEPWHTWLPGWRFCLTQASSTLYRFKHWKQQQASINCALDLKNTPTLKAPSGDFGKLRSLSSVQLEKNTSGCFYSLVFSKTKKRFAILYDIIYHATRTWTDDCQPLCMSGRTLTAEASY